MRLPGSVDVACSIGGARTAHEGSLVIPRNIIIKNLDPGHTLQSKT